MVKQVDDRVDDWSKEGKGEITVRLEATNLTIENLDDWSEDAPLPATTKVVTEVLTDKDIFKLAKAILAWCTIIFGIIAAAYVSSPILQLKEEMREVWSFSSQALYGVVTLILGLYFGGKIKDKN